MAKEKDVEVKETKTKKFVVLDSNGKEFRTYSNEDEAREFAGQVGGRIQR